MDPQNRVLIKTFQRVGPIGSISGFGPRELPPAGRAGPKTAPNTAPKLAPKLWAAANKVYKGNTTDSPGFGRILKIKQNIA